ncbi:MAG: heme-binding protein [Nocardioides sp.]
MNDSPLRLRSVIRYAAAQRIVAAAVAHAGEIGVPVNIAVCEPGGHLVAFAATDGAPFLAATIAQDKAWSVVSFHGIPTEQWHGLLPEGSALREGIRQRDRFVIFGGGLPIIVEGHLAGAIGVSGGTEEQDIEIATAGLAALA